MGRALLSPFHPVAKRSVKLPKLELLFLLFFNCKLFLKLLQVTNIMVHYTVFKHSLRQYLDMIFLR